MTENFLSFLWKFKLYNTNSLLLDNVNVEIISHGELNSNSGPDFFNAKIKIGDTIWVGNIEIHVKASDWNVHGHNKNQAYDNVILHVVLQNDTPVNTTKGRIVPTIELKFDSKMEQNYKHLMQNEQWIACASHIKTMDSFVVSSVIEKNGIECLENHTQHIFDNLEASTNNIEEAFYRQMVKSFGFHVNSQPFELLAKSLPYQLIKKYSENQFQLEALLFGQAGMLFDDYNNDLYYRKLKAEYAFLRSKHDLTPIDVHLWKYMRLRPGNFPTIRIAQLSVLLHRISFLVSEIIEASDVEILTHLLSIPVSEYWLTHYTFANESVSKSKTLGAESAKTIIINTIVPFYFVYGKIMGNTDFQDKSLRILEEIEKEKNVIVKEWIRIGVEPRNAFDSQALIYLKTNYCDKKRCLECAIGLKFIGNKQC